jgi:tetratricopeptide (TPR) repeat protein
MNKKINIKKIDRQELNTRKTVKLTNAVAWIQNSSVHVLFIILIAFLVYSNSFESPFYFDDAPNIVKNISVKYSLFRDEIGTLIAGSRTFGFLTFALNYKLHGLDVRGYHVVNLIIHLINSLLVYRLILLTFRTPYLSGYIQEAGNRSHNLPGIAALFTALLFVSHPIQTQAVTYIVQRFASLATLFYLLSLVLYIRFRSSETLKSKYAFYILSIVAAILAMKTKEIAFTLPVMIILYEFIFFRGEIKKRIIYLIPLVLTMIIIPLSLFTGIQGASSAESGGIIDEITKGASLNSISRWDYLETQFRVIVTYIRLLFLPVNQNLDYDYPLYKSFFNFPVFSSFLLLLAIFVWGVYLLYRSSNSDKEEKYLFRVMSFGIFWFFITLSVESSIIPIADVIYEHRLYLPSVGFFIFIMGGLIWIKDRWRNRLILDQPILIVLALIVIGSAVAAHARNTVWQDETKLWEDVVKKSPNKARGHNSLGIIYQKQGYTDAALKEYTKALILNPKYAFAYSNMGSVYEKMNLTDQAIANYQRALKINDNLAEVHFNLGNVYYKLQRIDDAVGEYVKAVKIKPYYDEAYYNLGNAYFYLSRFGEAAQAYKMAIKYNPEFASAYSNLGSVFMRQGDPGEAIKKYQMAVRYNPNSGEIFYNLGNAYLSKGDRDEAIKAYESALRLDPNHAQARQAFDDLVRNSRTHVDN